jgi:16S rRNA (guanine966-N2)-methyltransferase
MDNNRAALDVCRRNVRALGETAHADVLQGDCLNPVRPRAACTLAFLDPPYGLDLAPPAVAALADAGWIAPEALCIVETGAKENFEIPSGFVLLDDRRYGAARIRIFRREG